MTESARRTGARIRDMRWRPSGIEEGGTVGAACAMNVLPPAALRAAVSSPDPAHPPIVALCWQNPDENPEDSTVTIQRATDANFTLNLTTFAAGPGQTTFVDATSEPLTAYWYRVRAESADGCSPWSEGIPVVTEAPGTP